MNFRPLFIALFFSFLSFGQEEATTQVQDSTNNPERSFRFHFDVGVVLGFNASGDNFVAQAYDINPGIDISTSLIYNRVSFHFDIQAYSGDVINQEIAGPIADSRISRISLGLGYNFEIAPKFNLNPSFNYGEINFTSNLPDSENFRDDGEFISLELKGIYEISQTCSVFASVAYYQDWFDIQTAPSRRDFFRQVSHFNPSIGLRFSSMKIKRVKGEPGDGIFTRKDGL